MEYEYRIQFRVLRKGRVDWSAWRNHSLHGGGVNSMADAVRLMEELSEKVREKEQSGLLDNQCQYRLLRRRVGEWRECQPQLELGLGFGLEPVELTEDEVTETVEP